MIILVFVLLLVVLGGLVAALFLLGFRLGGGQPTRDRLLEVRREAARAERQLHDLTRQAFVSMAGGSGPEPYQTPSVRHSLLDSALRTTVAVVVIVVLLPWAWTMLHPLLGIIGIAVGIFLIVRAVVAYRRHW